MSPAQEPTSSRTRRRTRTARRWITIRPAATSTRIRAWSGRGRLVIDPECLADKGRLSERLFLFGGFENTRQLAHSIKRDLFNAKNGTCRRFQRTKNRSEIPIFVELIPSGSRKKHGDALSVFGAWRYRNKVLHRMDFIFSSLGASMSKKVLKANFGRRWKSFIRSYYDQGIKVDEAAALSALMCVRGVLRICGALIRHYPAGGVLRRSTMTQHA